MKIVLVRDRSVRGVSASAAAAVAATVATARRVASRRAVAAAHRGTVACVGTTTTARTAATSTSSVHTRQVGALGDHLQEIWSVLVFLSNPPLLYIHTFKFLFLKRLSFSTSACVTKLGSANSTYA